MKVQLRGLESGISGRVGLAGICDRIRDVEGNQEMVRMIPACLRPTMSIPTNRISSVSQSIRSAKETLQDVTFDSRCVWEPMKHVTSDS